MSHIKAMTSMNNNNNNNVQTKTFKGLLSP